MRPRIRRRGTANRSVSRRIRSVLFDLVLAMVFVGLWLVVLTRGEVLGR